MLVAVHAVGRMKAGPEQELAARYFDRFAKSGPAIGLEFSGVLGDRRRPRAIGRRETPRRGRPACGATRQGRRADRCSTNAARIRLGRPRTEDRRLRDGGRRVLAFVDRRAGRARCGLARRGRACAFLRPADLAAPAGARHAGRTALPRSRRSCRGIPITAPERGGPSTNSTNCRAIFASGTRRWRYG